MKKRWGRKNYFYVVSSFINYYMQNILSLLDHFNYFSFCFKVTLYIPEKFLENKNFHLYILCIIYQQGDIYPEGQLCDAQAFLMSYFGEWCL